MGILSFDDTDIDRYVTSLSNTVAAVRAGSLKDAASALEPITGEIWMGRLTVSGAMSAGEAAAGDRRNKDMLRARVFARDRFRCTACGGRAVPRCILVAVHDLFPDQLPFNINYKRGFIHPAFWALAPEADHVVAHSRGGPNTLENRTTLHAACNTQKSDGDAPPQPFPRPSGDDWGGLVSAYPALIAVGAGDARTAFHRGWSRRYAQVWGGEAFAAE